VVIVLLYHRVADTPLDPLLLSVSPTNFTEHLEFVRKHHPVLSLKELTRRLRHGKLPKRAIVVTFDDGYVDNLWNAKPLMERYEVPSTVFVTPGHIGKEREFWWDEIGRLMLQPGTLPETLHLNVKGSSFKWELGGAAHYSMDDYQRHRCWHILEKDTPSVRHRIYCSLLELLRSLPHGERDSVLSELVTWAGDGVPTRSDHRALTPNEVRQLAEGDLVDAGAHTMTHPDLSVLAVEAQRAEIVGGKKRLEEVLGQPVSSFSYPFGGFRHYTADTLGLVRDAGFDCACTNVPGVVTPKSDLYQLPRFLVRDWDGEEFARQITRFFSA
jgi:peptidoglycan/xylan/chitin deacetylase (PgdA/CDA1 family)